MNEYVDVWERAASRLVEADYHAEDLVDDWFKLWGKWVRDSTAAAALAWNASRGGAQSDQHEEGTSGGR